MSIHLADAAGEITHTRFGARARIGIVSGDREAPCAIAGDGSLRLGGISIAGFLVEWAMRGFDPTLRLRNLPVSVTLAPIWLRPGRIEIGPDGQGGGQR